MPVLIPFRFLVQHNPEKGFQVEQKSYARSWLCKWPPKWHKVSPPSTWNHCHHQCEASWQDGSLVTVAIAVGRFWQPINSKLFTFFKNQHATKFGTQIPQVWEYCGSPCRLCLKQRLGQKLYEQLEPFALHQHSALRTCSVPPCDEIIYNIL